MGHMLTGAACCIKRDFAVANSDQVHRDESKDYILNCILLTLKTGGSPMLAMVFSRVRYAPPIPGSLMRLKKLPIAVNMRVEVKEVNRPQTASIRKGLGWDNRDDAPDGK